MSRRITTALVAMASAVLLAPLAATPAQAAEPLPPFYQAPSALPSANGELIRTEPLNILIDPSKLFGVKSTATRVLYKSTNRAGKPIAVSGSVIVPDQAWGGPGRRPVIGYAVGTQGIGDKCAPSRLFSELLEYESIFMSGLLGKGYAIAMTDYEGLGTEGTHTYMDRESQGHTVIDMVRAAQRLPGSGLTAQNPVAFYGYSQGGGAAAAAAELASSYGSELKVKGTVAGAVPADLGALPGAIDGSLYAEFLWYAIAGISASYGLNINDYLNAKGQKVLADMQDNCVFDLFGSAFSKSRDYTVDGSSLEELITREPFKTMMADQRIGLRKPNAPVLVNHSLLDDVIPYRVGRQLAVDWCQRKANVRLSTNATPLHIGGMLNHAAESYSYLAARFAGLPAISSCWRL